MDLNGDARNAGIPVVNPQQSVRAVAAFKISEHLNLGIIPRTEFFVGTDEDGRPKLGQAMDVVNGPVGQSKVGLKNRADPDQKGCQHYEDIVNNPDKYSPNEVSIALSSLSYKVKVKDTWY